ncbi:hypothetical protein C5C56_11680 [Rathayibacter sp. AY1D1]|uniref:hypothetical protein n=1 Tax=Rathayibacter sp. AY1D1 TaxID=2080542 RepID=UPI000CE81C67|nr:hypothetical protein [Rathayibacter sp. AY1D1]PPH97807.1 hypothetical protein C5C56_11680 [Rathayibacter sp. AY1D1]
MPSYMITGGAVVTLSDRPLTVRLQMQAGSARLDAVVAGGPLTTAVRPRPDLLIVPRVTERTMIRLVPIGSELFPAGAVANVSVGIDDARSSDPERAVVPPLDLAGLAEREVVILEPGGDGVQVRGAGISERRYRLSGVAAEAQVATVGILGAQEVSPTSALHVVVALDGSASFRRFAEDATAADPSTAEAVVAVLDGVASVLSTERRRGAAVVGASVAFRAVPPDEPAERAVISALREAPRSSGVRSGAPALSGFAEGNTVTYVVTDAVPADIGAFEAADEIDGEARHLVVIGSRSAWQLQTPPSTPHTFIETDPAGRSLAEAFRSDAELLRRLVRSLLAGCFAPGTEPYARVGR